MSVTSPSTTTSSNKKNTGEALLQCCLAILLSALVSLPVQAQVQGILFTTPQQRAYLDYLRAEFLARSTERGFDIQQANVPQIPTDTVEQAPAPQIFTLGGIMARREGGHVIWLNGRSFTESELPAGISLQRNDGVLGLRFATSGGARFIKPGQTVELGAGVVQEAWEKSLMNVVAPPTETREAEQAVEAAVVEEALPEPLPASSSIQAELEANMPEMDSEELQQLIDALQQLQVNGNAR